MQLSASSARYAARNTKASAIYSIDVPSKTSAYYAADREFQPGRDWLVPVRQSSRAVRQRSICAVLRGEYAVVMAKATRCPSVVCIWIWFAVYDHRIGVISKRWISLRCQDRVRYGLR